MTERKHETRRPYPPDYVSAETLAYRLDCSRSTIDAYVREGLLPKPQLIGHLPRWDFRRGARLHRVPQHRYASCRQKRRAAQAR